MNLKYKFIMFYLSNLIIFKGIYNIPPTYLSMLTPPTSVPSILDRGKSYWITLFVLLLRYAMQSYFFLYFFKLLWILNLKLREIWMSVWPESVIKLKNVCSWITVLRIVINNFYFSCLFKALSVHSSTAIS